jgi:hypothetical protein
VARERVLITVKTYPTLSSKYDEVVCTAGLREDGTWVRIYPIPFRKLDDYEQYRKFDWVEVDLERNLADPRPESYRLNSGIKVLNHVDTAQNWRERRDLVLSKSKVYTNFSEIIKRNKNDRELSLATFKPTEIVDFTVEKDTREWDQDKLSAIEAKAQQNDLFQDNTKCFEVVRKLPYKFRYLFKDATGQERRLMISDWEIGALYWNELKRHGDNEKKAIESVKYKYLHQLVENRDIHLFVGTNQSWDLKNAPNPFIIIGVFSPPMVLQNELF